jgi:hypothetical protein
MPAAAVLPAAAASVAFAPVAAVVVAFAQAAAIASAAVKDNVGAPVGSRLSTEQKN